MSKKRRDNTSLSSLLGKKREIDIDEIEKATQKVHESKKVQPPRAKPQKKKSEEPKLPKKEVAKPQMKAKTPANRRKEKIEVVEDESDQVVRASIATPYELYLRAKRQQRKAGFRSLGAFYLHCVEDYLKKPVGKALDYVEPDFSDRIDVSVSPELELWTQIKLNQRRLGFKNMAGFYVFCLDRFLKK